MHEIIRVAKDERLIIVCTIHQPSTKVFQSFDKVMVLSKGREAFSGDVQDVIPYFRSIGYPCPQNTNPAEFFLDLVNAGKWGIHLKSAAEIFFDPTQLSPVFQIFPTTRLLIGY
jgi:ABC-type multidrug transport system ATPase subunit